jgi:amino acid transporter
MIIPRKFYSSDWRFKYSNAVLTGCVVAVCIIGVQVAINEFTFIGGQGVVLFCITHGLLMAAVISFYTEQLNPRIPQRWIKVPVLFLMGITGTLAATAFSFYVFSFFSRQQYEMGMLLNQAITNF